MFEISKVESNIDLEIQKKIDNKTKPVGSLGRLEEVALKVARIQKTLSPELKDPAMVVFAADHGIAKEGVSPYPQDVTKQMVLNFLQGGAAINVFSRQMGFNLLTVDAGVSGDIPGLSTNHNHPFVSKKVAHGTKNFLTNKAMSREELDTCLERGAEVVEELAKKGCNVIAFGEMGIGNTSSASCITSYLCNSSIEEVCCRGTGCDDLLYNQKRKLLERVIEFHGPLNDPMDILQAVSGFEISMAVGAMLKAAELSMVILVDGFIISSAALAAYAIDSSVKDYMVFGHMSASKGHKVICNHIGVKPLLDLEMRLGEGTGAVLSYPLVQASLAFLNEMASFEEANVSKAD